MQFGDDVEGGWPARVGKVCRWQAVGVGGIGGPVLAGGAMSTRNLTVSSGILRKWLSGNGPWCVFSKYWMEIVKKLSNFAVTVD
jgi:hypothetical protein